MDFLVYAIKVKSVYYSSMFSSGVLLPTKCLAVAGACPNIKERMPKLGCLNESLKIYLLYFTHLYKAV